MSKYKITDSLYRCECGKEFIKAQSLNAHFAFCLIHKKAIGKPAIIAESKRAIGKNTSVSRIGMARVKQIHAKAGKTLSRRIKMVKLFQHGKENIYQKNIKRNVLLLHVSI